MKNPTSGDLSVMLNSVVAAQHGHNFLYRGWDATTDGNPYACIIDANHSNSGKKHKEQIRIVKEVLSSRQHSDAIRKLVKGVMIESYIVEGNQKVGGENHVYGKSITDPCLGWEKTEALIYSIAEQL